MAQGRLEALPPERVGRYTSFMAYDPFPVGSPIRRKDGPDKTSGRTSFADDRRRPGLLHAVVLASPHAHAEIVGVDAAAARASSGVRGVFIGEDWKVLIGLYLGDKPPLARGRVLYHGEPVAAVVADDEAPAIRRFALVKVEYRPLSAIATPREALAPGAPILHPELGSYRRIPAILPEPGSNVANRTKIRKGDADRAMAAAEVRIRGEFSFPPGDHCAMEPRSTQAEILADGRVLVTSSTQSPFGVRNLLAVGFGIPQGTITVTAPAVGGGFGGKAGIQLEPLAYLLSHALGGRPVRLANTREGDMLGSPGRPGMEARGSAWRKARRDPPRRRYRIPIRLGRLRGLRRQRIARGGLRLYRPLPNSEREVRLALRLYESSLRDRLSGLRPYRDGLLH